MLVTTALKSGEAVKIRAQQIAASIHGRYVPRRKQSLKSLMETFGDHEVLLVTGSELKFYLGDHAPLFFHPSMAFLRIQRMLNGKNDPLIEASYAAAGDHVLDCTAGLASDSIVFSYAVGRNGKVTALESEQVVAMIVAEGLQKHETSITEVDQAMRRVHVKHANHYDFLRYQQDKSFDIVYFDPMFTNSVESSPAIQPLRHVAELTPLDPRAIQEALRVARKTVVLKERSGSQEFERLGFAKIRTSYSRIAYGVIEI